MKITDYLIIVATWLLSSFTFSSNDVEFKNIKEEQGLYFCSFGVVGHSASSSLEVESILLQLQNYTVTEVTKRDQDFLIRVTTTTEPNFHQLRKVFTPYGYEMDNRFFRIYNPSLLDEIVERLKKIRKDQAKTIQTQGLD